MRKHPDDFKDCTIRVTIEELVAMGAPQEIVDILAMVIEAHANEGDALKRREVGEEDA